MNPPPEEAPRNAAKSAGIDVKSALRLTELNGLGLGPVPPKNERIVPVRVSDPWLKATELVAVLKVKVNRVPISVRGPVSLTTVRPAVEADVSDAVPL